LATGDVNMATIVCHRVPAEKEDVAAARAVGVKELPRR